MNTQPLLSSAVLFIMLCMAVSQKGVFRRETIPVPLSDTEWKVQAVALGSMEINYDALLMNKNNSSLSLEEDGAPLVDDTPITFGVSTR